MNQIFEAMEKMGIVGDATSVAIIIGTVTDILPKVAAVIAIIYWSLRLYRLIRDWDRCDTKEDE